MAHINAKVFGFQCCIPLQNIKNLQHIGGKNIKGIIVKGSLKMKFTLIFFAQSHKVATQHRVCIPVSGVTINRAPGVFNGFCKSVVITQKIGHRGIK